MSSECLLSFAVDDKQVPAGTANHDGNVAGPGEKAIEVTPEQPGVLQPSPRNAGLLPIGLWEDVQADTMELISGFKGVSYLRRRGGQACGGWCVGRFWLSISLQVFSPFSILAQISCC